MIDGHAHVFGAAGSTGRSVHELTPPDRTAPVEELLGLMAGAGVSHAVLVPVDTADDVVADALARYPGRFAGVAVATDAELGRAGTDPVRALYARRARWPFAALRTGWLGDPARPVTDSPAMPMLRALAADGIVLWSYLPPDQLVLLERLVVALPELRVVLNHLGFCPHDMRVDEHRRPRFDDPFPDELVRRLERLADAPGVHVMVSGQYALSAAGPPYPDLFAVTRRLAAAYGPERLLWASDHPWPSRVPGYGVLPSLVDAALPDLD
ncbi:MAG: amidohydrolase family protein, partial [Pseudonocardia sp.]|nr:amidohydrolase family protein [Pseudonocardia sp.]